MAKRKTPFDLIIETWGGLRPAARVLGMSPATLYRWRDNGIPSRHIRRIIHEAAKRKVYIEADDLLPEM